MIVVLCVSKQIYSGPTVNGRGEVRVYIKTNLYKLWGIYIVFLSIITQPDPPNPLNTGGCLNPKPTNKRPDKHL